MSIAVIGCSGTGSPVIEQLARLGVGRLVIVDPDRVEEKNLNRILNATMEDVRLGLFKVDVLAHAIRRMELGTEVVPLARNLFDPEIIKQVAKCDVLFGCMDSVDGRHLLNRLAVFYSLPYFDVGVKLVADGQGGVEQICGTVHYLQPDGSSLLSRGVYTTDFTQGVERGIECWCYGQHQPSLTPAMQAYLIALIYRNTRSSCVSLASLCPALSHDALNRCLHSSFPWSRRLWELLASRMIHTGGYLVLDDTTWQRQTKVAEAVAKVWSSTAGGVRLGMQVVLLIWTDGKRKVPISMRLWQKGGKSKVELATEMLREAAGWGVQPKYVLFDSWYAARAIFNLLAELDWKYVSRIKSNRLLDDEPLKQKWPQRYGQACGHLRRVDQEVKVIKDGKRYWVTNDLELSPAQIKRQYRHRQQVEETFRLLKQEFGWGGSSVRKAAAQTAHLHLGLMALCLTQQAALAQGQTVYAFKRQLFRQPIPDQMPFLEYFLAAA